MDRNLIQWYFFFVSKRAKDFFYHQAKNRGAVARSVFKLEEMNQKYRLIKKKDRVMDIGAAPGSWIQYVSTIVGPEGFILGVDLAELHIAIPPHVTFLQQNILDMSPVDIFNSYGQFDLVISDVAPKTTGHRVVDQSRSMELCHHGFMIAKQCLKKNGHFICKMYQSENTKELTNELKSEFANVSIQKPESSRKESWEVFIMAINKK